MERLEAQSYGLDFGCGPGPTLSLMLEGQGHQLALFDIYYADNPLLLQGSYDFITGTEVVEPHTTHTHTPSLKAYRSV